MSHSMKKSIVGVCLAVIVVIFIVILVRVKGPTVSTVKPAVNAPTPSSTIVKTPVKTVSDSIQPSPILPKTVSIDISNMGFAPRTVNVAKGATVTWTNRDSVSHTVTSFPGGPSSKTLSKGQTYSFTFTQSGTVNYHCSIHPGMVGTVFVGEEL